LREKCHVYVNTFQNLKHLETILIYYLVLIVWGTSLGVCEKEKEGKTYNHGICLEQQWFNLTYMALNPKPKGLIQSFCSSLKHLWWPKKARHIFPSTPWKESLELMTCGSYNTESKFTSCYLEGPLGFKSSNHLCLLALPTTKALKDIVFRFIIEYSSLRDFYRPLHNRSIFIWGFLKDDILACVETWRLVIIEL
jgi:hypothetical protein